MDRHIIIEKLYLGIKEWLEKPQSPHTNGKASIPRQVLTIGRVALGDICRTEGLPPSGSMLLFFVLPNQSL
jgi:hypothetical protein